MNSMMFTASMRKRKGGKKESEGEQQGRSTCLVM
jgi:hypothetical protein